MSYKTRIDESITISYAGDSVRISYEERYYDRVPVQSVSIPVNKLDMVILALEDIRKEISKDNW